MERPVDGGMHERRGYLAALASVIAGIPAVVVIPTQFLTYIGLPLALLAGIFGVFGFWRAQRERRARGLALFGLMLFVLAAAEFAWLVWVCSEGC